MSTPIDIQQINDAFFEELGLDLLEPEEREYVVTKIGETIFEGVMLRTFDGLDEDKRNELTQLFDAANADQENEEKRKNIEDFIAAHVPQFDDYLKEEVEALKNAPDDMTAPDSA